MVDCFSRRKPRAMTLIMQYDNWDIWKLTGFFMNNPSMSPIELSIFSSRIEAVCDEMGAVLQRSAFSPNIKDRLDFSCAMFDARGDLCAQAAHIPVHMGSMAYAMRDVVGQLARHGRSNGSPRRTRGSSGPCLPGFGDPWTERTAAVWNPHWTGR